MKPVVAIVGRPNVGKSTLFNRLVGGRPAIVEDSPGVTRDRLYRDATWLDKEYTVIDTGGIDFETKENIITDKVKEQVNIAIEEAAVIIFVLDGKNGLTESDKDVAELLRKSAKPIVLAVNKLEDFSDPSVYYEFYSLGLGELIPISAAHGMNTGDLLDEVVKYFSDNECNEYDPDVIRMAVIGRPNVGKSSLVNKILGQDRSIVSDIPGTTRDAIDSRFSQNGKEYVIIDTAGMRRKARIIEPTERYSISRALRTIDNCDVVLMMIDATAGVTEQDKKIAGYAHEEGKACIIVVNKWDIVEKDDKTMKKFDEDIKEELGFMTYALTIYVSAKTGQRVNKIIDLVDFVAEQHSRRIPTTRLNEVVQEAVLLNQPPSYKGKRLKILYVTQVGVKPPRIVFFVNDPNLLHFSYERYLENKLRESFGFAGTPLWLKVRSREEEN